MSHDTIERRTILASAQRGLWSGRVICETCAGTGRVEDETPPGKMFGQPQPMRDCPTCLGRGMIHRLVETTVTDMPLTGREG